MRARAPAGRSVPEGHGASAELSRAPGICALLATPERTQHSLRPPPQVTGACSSFHPCPSPGAHSPPSPSPRGLSGAGGCLSSPRVQARSPRRRDTKPCLCFRNQKYATCRWWHRGPVARRPRGCAGLDRAATARQLPQPAMPCSPIEPRRPSLCLRVGKIQRKELGEQYVLFN